MAIIDVLKYEGPNDVLVWKWHSDSNDSRENELRLGTQVIVNESQEACFYKGGELLDILGPGTHKLTTKNIPILASIVGLLYGGDSPFSAEVFYVNKAVSLNTKFGLSPFNVMEQTFKVPLPVTCRGSYAVQVKDARLFLTKMIGTTKEFGTNELTEFFRGVISEKVKTAILQISREQKISPLELEGILIEVGDAVKHILQRHLEDFGLDLVLFNVEAIPVISDNTAVQSIIEKYQELMADDLEERLRLARRAENLEVYKVERSFDTTEKAAENLGSVGGGGETSGIIGTMVGLGMVNPIAQQMGELMAQNSKNINNTSNVSNNVSNNEIVELLEKLGKLRDNGVLTEQEFLAKKKELLDKLI